MPPAWRSEEQAELTVSLADDKVDSEQVGVEEPQRVLRYVARDVVKGWLDCESQLYPSSLHDHDVRRKQSGYCSKQDSCRDRHLEQGDRSALCIDCPISYANRSTRKLTQRDCSHCQLPRTHSSTTHAETPVMAIEPASTATPTFFT